MRVELSYDFASLQKGEIIDLPPQFAKAAIDCGMAKDTTFYMPYQPKCTLIEHLQKLSDEKIGEAVRAVPNDRLEELKNELVRAAQKSLKNLKF